MQDNLPEIVVRNKDVEHVMLASSQYGLHGYGKPNIYKIFSMLVATDVHECKERLNAAIDYLNYYDAIDCGICLGDMQARNYIETDGTWYTKPVLRANKEFYTVLGNHDNGNSADIRISATPQMAFEKFVLPTAEKIGIDGLDKPYYLKLFEKYKIALIVLDNYDAPDVLNEKGDYAICRSKEVYSQAQVDWFVSTLNSIPKGYHLLVAAHNHPYEMIVERGDWTHVPLGCDEDNPYGNNNMLADVLDAWIRGDSLKQKYTPIKNTDVMPTLTVDCDFSARGTGAFVCYLIGHHHQDAIAANAKYPNQKIVSFASTADDLWQNCGCDLPRTAGTKAEDLLTVVSVHTEKRQIRLVRIGSNFTLNMTERIYKVIEY